MTSWNKIIDAQNIRNIVAHNAGHLDKEIHEKQLKIVVKSSNLDYEEYARVHLNIKQVYLLEVIEAMECVANVLWKNTK